MLYLNLKFSTAFFSVYTTMWKERFLQWTFCKQIVCSDTFSHLTHKNLKSYVLYLEKNTDIGIGNKERLVQKSRTKGTYVLWLEKNAGSDIENFL